jgi:hypothetical protein
LLPCFDSAANAVAFSPEMAESFMKPLCLIVFVFAVIGCNTTTSPSINKALSKADRHLCDSLAIDSSVALAVRTHTDSVFQPFSTDLEMVLDKDMDVDPNEQAIPGFIFPANAAQAQKIISGLSAALRVKGFTIFLLDQRFGIGGKPDIVAVVKTVNQYRILHQVQTDGINFDINNDSLLSIVQQFDSRYSLRLIGAGGDWCEFDIQQPPANWMQIANEAYLVCPDIVEQGTGSVEKLAEEMKRTRRLYFWWD